jgi:hypothetical protein
MISVRVPSRRDSCDGHGILSLRVLQKLSRSNFGDAVRLDSH